MYLLQGIHKVICRSYRVRLGEMSVVVLILVMALNNKAVINEGKTALKACLAYDLDRKSINCTYFLVFPICPFRFAIL